MQLSRFLVTGYFRIIFIAECFIGVRLSPFVVREYLMLIAEFVKGVQLSPFVVTGYLIFIAECFIKTDHPRRTTRHTHNLTYDIPSHRIPYRQMTLS